MPYGNELADKTSHIDIVKNPDVQELYNKHLEAPNSHKAHELLHTSYINRRKDCYISVGE